MAMTLLATALVAGMAVLARKLGRRWVFPPALFALVWAFTIGLSAIVSPKGLSVGEDALTLFVAGVAAFLAGGVLALKMKGPERRCKAIEPDVRRFGEWVMLALAAILIVLLPFYIGAIQQAAQAMATASFGAGAREASRANAEVQLPSYFRALNSLAMMLAIYAAAIYDGAKRSKWVFGIATFMPLVYCGLTFARTYVYTLVFGVVSVLWVRNVVTTKQVVGCLLAFLAFAIVLGIPLNKGLDPEQQQRSLGSAVVSYVGDYFVGGPASFSYVMDNPTEAADQGLAVRAFTALAKSFGAQLEVPEHVLKPVGPSDSNVYSFYIAYWLEWRWLGALGAAFAFGWVSTLLYVHSTRGSLYGLMLFGHVLGAIPTSPIGDFVFLSATTWIVVPLLTTALLFAPRLRR